METNKPATLLRFEDLKAYGKMTVLEKHGERGKEIRAEIDKLMQWLPNRWRRIVRCRYIIGMSVIRTAYELHLSKNTILRETRKIAEYVDDREKYLGRIV